MMVRRASKYNNQPTPCRHGHVHDSAKEARRCNDLHLLERAGEISQLEQQPKFPIVVNGIRVCTYVGDFAYLDRDGKRVIEDVKGHKTDVYRLKKKLVEAVYSGVRVEEV